MSRRHLAIALLPLLLIGGGLAGCTPTAPASDQSDTDTGSDDTTTTDDGATDEGDDSFAGVTVPGDGTYAIPADIPYGGYQLVGDPGVLPDGCTWSITGSGGTVAESNGAYVFITEIDEADTFTTSGCPDWEQFE